MTQIPKRLKTECQEREVVLATTTPVERDCSLKMLRFYFFGNIYDNIFQES